LDQNDLGILRGSPDLLGFAEFSDRIRYLDIYVAFELRMPACKLLVRVDSGASYGWSL